MTYNSKRILLCIDDSESSKNAMDYVAALATGDDDFVINIFHAVGPIPMEFREFSGAENPKTEEHLDSELQQKQNDWARMAKSQARPLLENARQQLRALGIPTSKIATHLIVLKHGEDLVREILRTASANRCGTIVVGQSSFPWFKELFASHTGEELLKQSEGFGVCIVQ
jgi:nucleotide-binding universal stress UspA family protein